VSQPPPPGWVPPDDLPGRATAPGTPYAAPYAAPMSSTSWRPPVHRPGVVPLRPLRLGDFFDGAFTTIRRNPTAMVGLAAAVTALFLVVPALLSLVLAGTGHLSLDLSGGSRRGGVDALASGGVTALSYLGTVFGSLATVVLNGLLVRVVAEAVLGRRTSAADAWAATRGRLLRLVGLTALNLLVVLGLLAVPAGLGVLTGMQLGVAQGVLVGVPLVLAGVVALAFVQVRYFQLAAPALVLERIGVFAALRRAGGLSRGQFWRLLGVQLLTLLVVGVVSQVLAVPLTLLGLAGPLLLPGTTGGLVLVLAGYLAQVVVGAVTTPFTSAVVALQYVDQRIRKEGLDVQLIAAAQQATPGGH
jgi:hypothetical protein